MDGVKKAYIVIDGCDDYTCVELMVDYNEYRFLKKLQRESRRSSKSQCQPILTALRRKPKYWYNEDKDE